MPPATVQFLASYPDVEMVDTFREIELPMGNATVAVAVVRGTPKRRFQFIHGNTTDIMHRFLGEACVVISESFARRHRIRDGESIELTTPEGVREFPVAGIFYDYSRDQGIVYMSTKTFVEFWHDDRVNSVAVFLKDAGSGEALSKAFRQQFSTHGEYIIYANRSLRTRVFEIFDQTFAVTYVLRTIAVIVAITGIFLSLTILIAERSRELAMCASHWWECGAGPQDFAVGNRDARNAGSGDRGGVWALSVAGANRSDQSRVLRLDDPACVSVAFARADAGVDHSLPQSWPGFCQHGGRDGSILRKVCAANEDV